MPVSMIHLSVARKVNPDATIAFYVGSLAPDAIRDGDIKNQVHLYHLPDREDALKVLTLNANNDYLKGFYLHLFSDKKFHTFWDENTYMPYQEGKEFWEKFMDENYKINSYAYHNTEWAYSIFKAMEDWDYNGFTETELIKINHVKWFIPWNHERVMNDKLESSSVFPPALVEKLINDTVEDFNKWFSGLEC